MDWSAVVPFTKFLHVAAMFSAATIIVGADLYFLRVAAGGSAVATAQLGHAIRRRGPLTGPILEIGVGFGILTALLGGFNLLAPWLIAAYAVVIVMIVFAFRVAAPEFSAILELADAGDDAALRSKVADGRFRWITAADAALFAAAIFLMVVKPFV